MHPLVALAKDAVELFIETARILEPREEAVPPEFRGRAGVFVCLKTHGELRGCIGTFLPAEPSIAQETVRNAISAAVRDPRFPRVRENELAVLEYTVDVLNAPEKIEDRSGLDPARYGVIVQAGSRRGLLLPDLEGVDTADMQIGIAMQKAGIPPGTAVELFRFEVRRFR
jgi:AmmeMemoRadiSam system protein A